MKVCFIFPLLLALTACSPSMNSCLDDGISTEQVQAHIEQGRRDELLNQLQFRAKSGEVAAQYFLGFIYWSEDPQTSFDWFKTSAESGCLEGARYVAQSYLDGSIVKRDEQQAFHWHLRLAESGDNSAMRMVSHMYKVGQGVEKNREQARAWATKSWQ